MNTPKSLVEVLFEPRRETIVGFLAGLFFFGLATNLVYDLLMTRWPSALSLVITVIVLIALLSIAFVAFNAARTRARRVAFKIEENTPYPPLRRGLVWVLSPSGVDHALVAIRHHYGDGSQYNSLRHCWIIQQRDVTGVVARYQELLDAVRNEKIGIDLHPIYVDELTVRAAYNALVEIVSEHVSTVKLNRSDLMVDITGGTKPVTAGLVLAAVGEDCLLQYVETDRDDRGQPLWETARVVNVSRQAYLETA